MGNKKYNIVHVSGGYLGIGSSQKEVQLVHAQLNLGYHVEVIASSDISSNWLQIYLKTNVNNNDISLSPKKNSAVEIVHRLKPFINYKNLLLCFGVRSLVKKLKPDIWHLHEPSMGLPAQVVCHLKKNAVIVVDQHQYTTSFNHRFLVDLEYAIIRRHFVDYVYRHAKAIVSVTKGGIQFLKNYHHITSPKPYLIPIGVDTDIFKVMPSQRILARKKYNYCETDIVIINTGKIEPFKKHIDLFKAFALAYKKVPSLKLMIVGEGNPNFMNIIFKELDHEKITHCVTIVPYVSESELAVLFNAADIAVWPLFPTVSISQAIACGKPLILSTHPSQSHYLDYGCGLGYSPSKVNELSDRIISLATNDEIRKSISKHNAIFAQYNLSTQNIARKYESIYEAALRNNVN